MAGEVRPYDEREIKVGNRVIKVMSKLQTTAYRLTNGKIGGSFLRGAPVGILYHTGRRSGERRESPLLVLEDGPNVVVVASKGGFPGHPAWYYNLLAHPDCGIQIGGDIRRVRARVAEDHERPDLWRKLDAMYPDFAEYRERAAMSGREIAIFVLEPR